MKQSLLAATAILLISTAAASAYDMRFTVPLEVSGGHMNVRNGPGTNHGLVGVVPAGQTVTASRCAPRDDGIAGAAWCLVSWGDMRGWVSQAGLMPVGEDEFNTAPAPRRSKVSTIDWTCATQTTIVSAFDPNPVVSIRIRASGIAGRLQELSVVQTLMNGESYERMDQYNINTQFYNDAAHNQYGWSGSWNKNLSVMMTGTISLDGYTELQTKNGVTQFKKSTPCFETSVR